MDLAGNSASRAECPHPTIPHHPGNLDGVGLRTFRSTTAAGESSCELLILADGTVLARNLTQQMAEVLAHVAPNDSSVRHRAFPIGASKEKQEVNRKERNAAEPQPKQGDCGIRGRIPPRTRTKDEDESFRGWKEHCLVRLQKKSC
jgi:hypothetical protein